MTALRALLITPFPDMTVPEYIPNPDTTTPRFYPGDNFVPNPASEHNAIRREFADAAAWTARLFAATQDYHSDSTIDSHNAMIETLTALHYVIYGNDQTMDDDEAIRLWLDEDGLADALVETANPNTGMPDDLNDARPALFARFNLDYDALCEIQDHANN